MQYNIVKLATYDHNRIITVKCFLSQEEYRFNVFKTGYIRLRLELSGRSVSKNNQLHSSYQLPHRACSTHGRNWNVPKTLAENSERKRPLER